MTSSWFFVGLSDPKRLFLYESMPRVAGTVVGVVVVFLTKDILLLPVIQIVSAISTMLVVYSFVRLTQLKQVPTFPSRQRIYQLLASQWSLVTTAGMAAVYSGIPMILVSRYDPASLIGYGMVDRLRGYAVAALTPVDQVLQGWVPRAKPEHLRDRIKRAVAASSCLAVGVAGGFVLLSGPAARFLSGGEIEVPFSLVLPMALVLLLVTISHCLGLACLMALRAHRSILRSTMFGALVGIPGIAGAAIWGNAEQIAWAVALVELGVTVYQGLALRLAMRKLGAGFNNASELSI
nr:hypothetical protein [Aeromicrobium sp. S22]